jgi:hypothetical protein
MCEGWNIGQFLEALVRAPYKESDMVELQEVTPALECRLSLFYSGGVAGVYVHALFLCQLKRISTYAEQVGSLVELLISG